MVLADRDTIISPENSRHSSLAIAGSVGIDGVDYIHDGDIPFISLRSVVYFVSRQAQEDCLSGYGQSRFLFINQLQFIWVRQRLIIFF